MAIEDLTKEGTEVRFLIGKGAKVVMDYLKGFYRATTTPTGSVAKENIYYPGKISRSRDYSPESWGSE